MPSDAETVLFLLFLACLCSSLPTDEKEGEGKSWGENKAINETAMTTMLPVVKLILGFGLKIQKLPGSQFSPIMLGDILI